MGLFANVKNRIASKLKYVNSNFIKTEFVMQRGSVDHQETSEIPESQEFGPI